MDASTIFVPVLLLTGVLVLLLLFLPLRKARKTPLPQSIPPSASNSPSILPSLGSSLTSIAGPLQGQSIPIVSSYFAIGRSKENELVIDGGLVSRQHAIIAYQQGQYVLFDRESTNGTWINGRRVAQYALQPGDQIMIGPAVLVFQSAGSAAESPPVRPIDLPHVPTPSPEFVAQRVYGLEDYSLTLLPGGEGGAARVYRGVSREDGSVVAVKVLIKADPYLRTKFEQEGRKIGLLLRHPHITEVLHYGETQDGTFYILMEYVGNGSLRQRIRPRVGLTLDEAVRVVGETCDALQYAHSQGIVHRDIKPENILFGERHEVKLADFGIAKLAGAMTVTQDGLLIGTPYYMSYEQAKGLPVDARSDIYALGVVLYEMLTGCVPFTGDALTVVHKHLTEMPVPPSRLSSSIPPHVEQVVLKALEKDVNKRYANAEQMARALGYTMPFSQPGSTSAKPIGARPVKASLQRTSPVPGHLTVLHSGHVLPLMGNVTVLHRREINPDDALISRDHARVVRRGGNWWLEDIRSTNGTFLNGQRIFEPALMRAGDEVRLGSTLLRIG